MPADTAVPDFVSYADVDLVHAGTWDIHRGGTQQFTREELAAAIDALACPAVRRPIIKLGHDDSRFAASEPGDGEPALGWATNLKLAHSGRTLRADLVGMPAWLKAAAPSAYPDRSVEGFKSFTCQLGHLHPFVITAVSLLGVTRPGIGTLRSLQDHVKDLYGVAAGADDAHPGEPVAYTIRTSEETPMPGGTPIAAAISDSDIRDAFRESAVWDMWIVEIQLNPLQLICTTADGDYVRIPVTLPPDGANDDAITFGAPVPIEVTYTDSGEALAASAGAQPKRLTLAKLAPELRIPKAIAAAGGEPEKEPERPDTTGWPATPSGIPIDPADLPPAPAQPATAPAPTTPAEPTPVPAAEPEQPTEKKGDDMSLSEFRSRLGLPDDADEATVLAKLDEKLKTPEPVAAAAALPPGVVAIEASALTDLRTKAEAGARAEQRQRTEDRDRFIAAAVTDGKFAPARRDHWVKAWDADPEGTKATIDGLEKGLVVPVAAKGRMGTTDEDPNDAEFAEFDRLFSNPPTAAAKG